MKPGTITHAVALLLSTVTPLFAQVAAQPSPGKSKVSWKSNTLVAEKASDKGPTVFAPTSRTWAQAPAPVRQFAWKSNIVTTVFWIGEGAAPNNPVPNKSSSWDKNWSGSYGGYDDPDPARRRNLIPINFAPKQNPFYCALPYNDKALDGHRPEAPQVVPWFKETYQGPAVSTCKGRWIAIRKGGRTAYAQWEDSGPFRTDHWQYVFGEERPKPNLNQGAGLDVSPAVREFLGLQNTDVTDWKFVEFKEVPPGPWARYGENNTFVMNQRKSAALLVQSRKPSVEISPR